jgi:hypothetical protein
MANKDRTMRLNVKIIIPVTIIELKTKTMNPNEIQKGTITIKVRKTSSRGIEKSPSRENTTTTMAMAREGIIKTIGSRGDMMIRIFLKGKRGIWGSEGTSRTVTKTMVRFIVNV